MTTSDWGAWQIEIDNQLAHIRVQQSAIIRALTETAEIDSMITDRLTRLEESDARLTERMAETQAKVEALDRWFGVVVGHIQDHVTDPDAHRRSS